MGRKPKYDNAMTSAEKSREYRARKKQAGQKQIYFSLSGEMVDRIDELVAFFGLPGRAEVINELIQRPLAEALMTMDNWKSRHHLPQDTDALSPEDAQAIRDLKETFWKALCVKLTSTEEPKVNE